MTDDQQVPPTGVGADRPSFGTDGSPSPAGFGAPLGHGAPFVGYGPPPPGFVPQPSVGYGPPAPGFVPQPSFGYGPPAGPQAAYGAPPHTYAAPFGAPASQPPACPAPRRAGPSPARPTVEGGQLDGASVLTYVWNRFVAHLGVFLGGTALWVAAAVAVVLLVVLITVKRAIDGDVLSGALAVRSGAIFVSLAVGIAVVLFQAGLLHVALRAVRGERASLRDLFVTPGYASYVCVALLIGAVTGVAWSTGIGWILVPGIMFATAYAVLCTVDQGLGPLAAFKAAWRLAIERVGITVAVVIAWVVAVVGAVATAGIIIIVTAPLAALVTATCYAAIRDIPQD